MHLLAILCLVAATIGSIHADCEFISAPENLTLSVGATDIVLTCDATGDPRAIVWNHFLNGVRIDRIGRTDSNPSIYQFDNGKLRISSVTIYHHGTYICSFSNPCTEVFSFPGSINVQSKIEFQFHKPSTNHTDVGFGNSTFININMFGYPEPTYTLQKSTDNGYQDVADPRISVNSSGILITAADFDDEGTYQLIANNSEGTSMVTFTLNVTGVSKPDVSLSGSRLTPMEYGDQSATVTCTVPENSFDLDSGGLVLDWRRKEDMTSVGEDASANIYSTKLNQTAIVLNVQRVEMSDNGEYVCYSSNRMGQNSSTFTIIGPPNSVSNLKHVTVDGHGGIVTWDTPDSFGANLKQYMLRFEYSNGSYYDREVDYIPNMDPQYSVSGICPNGAWTVTVTAVNVFGGIGIPSMTSINIVASECEALVTQTTTTTQKTMSSSQITTSTNTRPTITTSTSTEVRTRSIISTTTTTTTRNTEPTVGTATSDNSSLPIAAGAAAATFVLIVLIAVLIFAIACYITITKRGSGSRAEQQWRHQYSSDHIDNGFVEANTLSAKLPESQLNGAVVAGLPSPIPATPGFGPVYIDPHYEFPRDNLEFTDILYDGAYTVIYKAKAVGIKEDRPIDVAVKQIKEEFLDFDDYSSALIMEMEQLAQLEPHPNIVGLVRVCSVSRPVLMVMQYMCHGDLLGFLRTTRGHTDMYTVNPGTKNLPTQLRLHSRDLLTIIKQVATGMQFLSEQKIVHGALCARNILVTSNMEVKIFNIGVHNLDNDETFESLVRWMAPEVFVDGVRTTYGDVWSFGVLMWEVVTVGGTPYSELVTDDLYTQLMSGVRLQKPQHCAQFVYDVMLTCWETIPQHRPLFFEINEHLQNMNLSKTSFLDLRNYNDSAYSQFDESERQHTSIL